MTNCTLELVVEMTMVDLMDSYMYECTEINHIGFDKEEFIIIHYDLFPYESFKRLFVAYTRIMVEYLYDAAESELTAEDQFYEIFDEEFESEFVNTDYNISVDAIKVYIENLVQHLNGLGVEEIFDNDLTDIRRVGDVYTLSFTN